ncbi:hypothetical protein LIER_12681 [Lithospermum erythrorhizon]|uniref:Uncharacterized protein n=1 Tax=Lithospermum erythrorhizon TaxID=34254 RepID=A0AAV3PWT4_LITER
MTFTYGCISIQSTPWILAISKQDPVITAILITDQLCNCFDSLCKGFFSAKKKLCNCPPAADVISLIVVVCPAMISCCVFLLVNRWLTNLPHPRSTMVLKLHFLF